jgi:hypothetical protein
MAKQLMICEIQERLAVAMLYQSGLPFRRQLDTDPSGRKAAERLLTVLGRDRNLREIMEKVPD